MWLQNFYVMHCHRFEFIETCWEREPKQRPTMTEVCKEIDKYLAVTEERKVAQKPNNL